MAQEFDFNNPLKSVDLNAPQSPLLEEEEKEEQPQFTFVNPLKDIPAPTIGSKIAREVVDVVGEPVAGFMFEADQRRPDAFFENLLYIKDAFIPKNIMDGASAAIESFKLQATEDAVKRMKGEIPLMLPDGSYDTYSQAILAERYANMSKEEKAKDEQQLESLRSDTLKEIGKINQKIAKRQNDAGLGDYGKTVSSGLESMAIITTAMGVNAVFGGRLTAPVTTATLGYFGAQTQGLSYAEARRQGKDHETALAYGNIQGALEVATEAVPIARYLSPVGGKTVKDILKRGFADVAADTGFEVINGVLQEVNTASFDLQSDLRTAYDNRNNPLYEGPTMSEVLKDVAGHSFLASIISSGAISSIRSTGEVIYSPEVKSLIKNNKDNPELEKFIESFNAVVNNSSVNYEALDKAVVKMFDPNYNQGVTVEELISDTFLNSNFIKLEDAVEGDIIVDRNIPLINQIDQKFPDIKPEFSFTDPLGGGTRDAKQAMAGEPVAQDSELYNQTVDVHAKIESKPPAYMKDKIDVGSKEEIDMVRNRIIYPRRFHDGVIKDLDANLSEPDSADLKKQVYTGHMKYTKDLNFSEANNLAAATVDLFKSGLPLDIFTDLRFIGALNLDRQSATLPYGQYSPVTQSLFINPASGLANFKYDKPQGAKIKLRSMLSHELGHHIDYGIGRDRSASYAVYSPASISSPLLDIPDMDLDSTYANDGKIIANENKGAVFAEALNLYLGYKKGFNGGRSFITNRPFKDGTGSYFESTFLAYPLQSFMSAAGTDAMTSSFQDMIKAETFAQMYSLYYTNREFLKDNAPITFKLIEDLHDAISADSPRAKNERVLRAFQSSRAPRSVAVPSRGETGGDVRPIDTQQQTRDEVEAATRTEDGDGIRSAIPQLNNTSLLDFIKQNPEGFTIDPETLESPSSGFAVAPVKALEIVVDQNQINDDILQSYVDNIKELSDRMNRDVYAGGWLNEDNGKYYLDATVVFDTMEDALYVAEAAQQEAIFDLGTFNETRTEQGIQELEETGRLNSQARDEQRSNIQQLSKLFETTRNLRGQEPVAQRKVTPPPTTPKDFDLDVEALLTNADKSRLFKAFSTFQELGIDKLDRMKGFMEKLKDYLPENLKDIDIIRSTDTFYGKVKTKLDDAVDEAAVINKFLRDNNIKSETFNQFLKNLHAPERNKAINTRYSKELPQLEQALLEAKEEKDKRVIKGKITKAKNVLAKYQDSGSGIRTEDAIANLKKLGISFQRNTAKPTNKQGKKLMEAFDMYQKYLGKTREIYLENDLVSQDTIADWDASYKYYVPLVGFAVDTITDNKPSVGGRGQSLFGQIIPQAKGRTTEAGNPFSQAVVRRSEAAVLGERNEIFKELATLVREFPVEGIWKVQGAAKFKKPHKWDGKESLIAFKEEGKTKFLSIRDERLARGLDEFGTNTVNPIVRVFRAMTSYLSAIYTQYSPEFIVTNFTKDYQTGIYNLITEQGMEGGRARGKKILGKALNPKTVYKNLGVLRKGYVTKNLKEKSPEDYKMFRGFLENGGATGYVNAKDVDVIEKEMVYLSRAHDGLPINPQRLHKGISQLVGSLNNVAENVSRYSVFEAFVNEAGGIDKASKTDIAKAADLAKNLTINFNRSGRLGPYVNALFVFANASVQGNVNFFRGMVPFKFDAEGKMRYQPISKPKKYIMAGGVGFGALVAIYNTLVGGEDDDGKLWIDKIPPHKQERNIVVLLPFIEKERVGTATWNEKTNQLEDADGKPIALTIPLPYGYNLFYNMGRMAVEYSTEDLVGYQRRSEYELIRDMTGVAVGNFSPVGAAYDKDGFNLGKTLVPSVAKPWYETQINEKWTGAPVYKEQLYGSKLPKSSVKLRNTEEFYREFTQMLNKVDAPYLGIKGGGEADAGTFNISPDVIKYMMQSYLGGLYSTIERGAGTVSRLNDVMQGVERDIPLNSIPFSRIFLGEPEDYTDQYEFYGHKEFLRGTPDVPGEGIMNSYEKYEEIGEKKGDGEFKELIDFIERSNFKEDYKLADQELKIQEKRIREINKLLREAEELWKEDDRAQYFEVSNKLNAEKYQIMRSYNKAVRNILPQD